MSFSWINYIRTSKNSVKQVVVLTFVYLPPLLPSQLLESWSVNLWSEYRHLTRNHEILFPPFRHLCSLHAFWIWAGSGRKLSHLQGRPCPYHFRANCPKVFSSLTGASFLFKNKNLQKWDLVYGILEDVLMRKKTPRGWGLVALQASPQSWKMLLFPGWLLSKTSQ